jgi:protein-disulfide isomerase
VSPFKLFNAFRSIFVSGGVGTSFKRAFATLCILAISAGLGYSVDRYLDLKLERYKAQKEQELFEKAIEAFANERPQAINLEPLMIIGDPNAPMTIVEFSDFLCPYCAKAARAVDQLVQENPDKVKAIFANYPLDLACNRYLRRSVHPGACLLAAGAICATEQGRFEEYQRIVFQTQMKRPIIRPTLEVLRKLAQESGLMIPEFIRCLANRMTLNTIVKQVEEGKRLGITGTPTIFINGKRYKGRVEKEWLQKFIDMEWGRMKGTNP